MITEHIEHVLTVLPDGQIQVRQDRILEQDGQEITRLYHRHVVEPGQDVTEQPERVKRIADAVWTPEVVEEFRQRRQRDDDGPSGR